MSTPANDLIHSDLFRRPMRGSITPAQARFLGQLPCKLVMWGHHFARLQPGLAADVSEERGLAPGASRGVPRQREGVPEHALCAAPHAERIRQMGPVRGKAIELDPGRQSLGGAGPCAMVGGRGPSGRRRVSEAFYRLEAGIDRHGLSPRIRDRIRMLGAGEGWSAKRRLLCSFVGPEPEGRSDRETPTQLPSFRCSSKV